MATTSQEYTLERKTGENTSEEIKFPASSVDGLSTVATSGSYNDLTNKPTNYVTTDTTQTISSAKTFTAQPIINTPNGLKFTSGNCALRIYNTSASPTDYSAIEVRSNSSTKRNLFVDLDINSLVVGQASGTADTTYKVNVKDSFNATTIYENGIPLSDKYCSDNSKFDYFVLTNEDLNTVIDAGRYRAEQGHTCAHRPIFGNPTPAFFLIVEKTGSGFIKQTVYRAEHSNNVYYEWYVRYSNDNGSSWKDWTTQQSMSATFSQTFYARKSFYNGISISGSLQFGSNAGSNGQFAMSQGSAFAPKWVNLQVKVNGTTYTADNSGLIDLGTIGGGSSTQQFNDIY